MALALDDERNQNKWANEGSLLGYMLLMASGWCGRILRARLYLRTDYLLRCEG
jgi:hypothetical protein